MRGRALRLAVVAIATFAPAAIAQPIPGTEKFQPAILDLRACIRASAPQAYIADIRAVGDAIGYFQARCFPPYSLKLAGLGAGDVSLGSFRLVAREEWAQFMLHIEFH